MCTSPAAYASRIWTGLSIKTRSTLNGLPSAPFHSWPALKPLLASTMGAQPAQTLSANRTVSFYERLVSGRSLHGRQLLGRLEVVFLDGGRAGGVGRLGGLIEAKILGLDLARLWSLRFFSRRRRLRCHDVATIIGKRNQTKNHHGQRDVERGLGLSSGHVSCSSLRGTGQVATEVRPVLFPSLMPRTCPCKQGPGTQASLLQKIFVDAIQFLGRSRPSTLHDPWDRQQANTRVGERHYGYVRCSPLALLTTSSWEEIGRDW